MIEKDTEIISLFDTINGYPLQSHKIVDAFISELLETRDSK
jgi:hypothetical protein